MSRDKLHYRADEVLHHATR